jgi:hypothetical protein
MKNYITSVEHFRAVLLALLDRAKKNLQEDRDLRYTALLVSNEETQQLFGIGLSIEELATALRQRVAQRPRTEYAAFVGLAYIKNDGKGTTDYSVVRRYDELETVGKGKAEPSILIEGSHRDFGEHAAHVCFKRIGENGFSFGQTCTGPMNRSRAVSGLWPKRRLNS